MRLPYSGIYFYILGTVNPLDWTRKHESQLDVGQLANDYSSSQRFSSKLSRAIRSTDGLNNRAVGDSVSPFRWFEPRRNRLGERSHV
jgi:hypothetical protein